MNPISRGVLLDRDTLSMNDVDFGRLSATLPEWTLHPLTSPEQIAGRLADAEVVVSNKVVLNAEILRSAPHLKLICVAATGTNNVDIKTAKELGISVANVRSYGTPSVVQHVFSLILSLTTRLGEHGKSARDGTWARSPMFCVFDYPIRELTGKTLGIIGYGELGHGVAQIARAFGMEVVIGQRPGGDDREGRLPLDDLLSRSDVVSLHLPLTEDTRNLIGPHELGLMKPDALLINTARGGIVDEHALVAALNSGSPGGAGFDVLSAEPPDADNPLLTYDRPNLIVTPHVAWASREARQRLVDQVADIIQAFRQGELRNPV
ncbi:MAG: 2-hydroxyacid dehydrogenase [Gammaproteobacteria bacterium]|nr:2-hydroxyacid dehydrogenase [Gammaproteobacteria bacterium]